MKDAQTSKEAVKIFRAIEDRLSELWEKLTVGNYNEATQFVYQIGFIDDINECLKKLKMKRSITNFTYNDLEVVKDFSGKGDYFTKSEEMRMIKEEVKKEPKEE